MKKSSSWFIYFCLILISITAMTGCSLLSSETSTSRSTASSSNAVLTPPSSQYLADIVGRVTLISYSVIKGGKSLPTPVPGSQFWVVQIFVKDKGYQTPIRFGPAGVPWSIQIPNSQIGPEEIGDVPDWIGGSSATISQGQTGEVTLLFIVHPGERQSSSGGIFFDVTPTPNSCRLRYIGDNGTMQVDSYGSLESTGKVVGVYNWDSQTIVQAATPSPSSTQPTSPIPFGTYEATTAFGSASITLNADGTYAMTGGLAGKDVGTYTISSSQITLRSANPSVGTYTQAYSYSAQFKCLYLGPNSSTMIPYYRK